MVKKFDFWRNQQSDPHFGALNFVKFYLYFMFVYPENFMCLAWSLGFNPSTIKKFEFWRPRFKEEPLKWYPQILSDFIFPSYSPILKISSV